jgi:RNAse (barnase) inhibitor barstar
VGEQFKQNIDAKIDEISGNIQEALPEGVKFTQVTIANYYPNEAFASPIAYLDEITKILKGHYDLDKIATRGVTFFLKDEQNQARIIENMKTYGVDRNPMAHFVTGREEPFIVATKGLVKIRNVHGTATGGIYANPTEAQAIGLMFVYKNYGDIHRLIKVSEKGGGYKIVLDENLRDFDDRDFMSSAIVGEDGVDYMGDGFKDRLEHVFLLKNVQTYAEEVGCMGQIVENVKRFLR